jgi:hypothetical protein
MSMTPISTGDFEAMTNSELARAFRSRLVRDIRRPGLNYTKNTAISAQSARPMTR